MTKSNEATRLAYRKGYRVTEHGNVVNAVGHPRKCQVKRRGGDTRLVFNIAIWDKSVYPILVHKLQAYQKFGEDAFQAGVVVRHLNGNAHDNTPDNINIGSISDNAMDRDPIERSLHSQKGNRGTGVADENTWVKIKVDHENGLGYKKLRTKYGVSLSSLSYRLSKTSQYRLLENR